MDGKVALITGSARGLGRGFAEILLENGVKVCLSDINVQLGEQTKRELQFRHGKYNVIFHKCDVTSDEELEGLFQKTIRVFGRLDIVVNNAGVVMEHKWREMIKLLLDAVIQGTHLAIKYMGTDHGGDGGLVINTSSVAGILPLEFSPHYSAAKTGVVAFSRSLGMISPRLHGIRINAVCPGFVDTDFINFDPEELKKGQLYAPEHAVASLVKAQADLGGRLLTVDEVKAGFWALVKEEGISGQAMIISPEGSGVATNMPHTLKAALKFVPQQI